MKLANPLLPGFHPDPSIVRVGDDYYLVTSSFEYVPGMPVHHSTDLVDWQLIGHIVTRTEQFDASNVPTGMGIWAPTIRWHDGLFHVIVASAGVGTRVYTATDPAGPWSDGIEIVGLNGIDPDIAWTDDGSCYVTFSGLVLSGPDIGRHLGIQQVRVDPASLQMLEAPRSLWSGTGGMFPEAPHLYRIGEWWYLMIAEGGTERGHAVTIARSAGPEGPFEGGPTNPVLTARGSARPVQNTGHGDLVVAPDGSWSMVMLGMRTRGMTRSFSALGRETFGTHVEWVDGWPVADPVELTTGRGAAAFHDGFDTPELGPEWIGVRRAPSAVSRIEGGALVMTGEGRDMSHSQPTFVGRRQRILDARISTVVTTAADGVAGLSIRYDEAHHYDVEVRAGRATGRVRLPSISHEVHADIAPGRVELALELRPVATGFPSPGLSVDEQARRASCDTIHLVAVDSAGVRHELAVVDGRFLTAESACSFTGRVAGVYVVSGEARFDHYTEQELA